MMRQYELLERVQRYNPQADEGLLNKAYVYAMQKHGTQKRANGDPYFSHPLEVAGILTDLKLDDSTIAVALLHDTIEDTDATRAEIDGMFGEDIGRLVEGLTKIKRLDLVTKKAAQAENFRKLLLAISEDVRVLLVKLADRLHNMRTLHFMPVEKRGRIAEETLEIYAPLAGRMGMHDMREELEELAFAVVNPEAHRAVSDRLAEIRIRNHALIEEIEKDLRDKLEKNGIKAKVYGREKRPYSIFRKMERKAISFEQLSDIIGFRVLVEKQADCYAALGIVHMTWPTVPGRFKDYISTPKQNDYRSIHTTVVGPGRQRVELQIRTREMHDVAEYGIAAHALYKDKVGGRISDESRAYTWLRRTVEMLAEGDTPEEFLENTKLELFHDQVFCFTPKGRLIALPRGATPIDFAYAVHTDVGDTCVGCKLNGRMTPLNTELKNGDEVEIITAKGQVPPPAWESIAVTGKARASIRRAARTAIRKQYAGLGRKIVERAFERAGREFSEEKLKAALSRLAQQNVEDMLASVGRGEIPSANVLKAVYPDHKEERAAMPKGGNGAGETGWFGLKKGSGMIFRVPNGDPADAHAIPIRGLAGDMPVRFAPEGGAVPGDRIVGILSPGEGITIYPIQSPGLKEFDDEPERWLDVRWDIDAANRERFPAQIEVIAINEPGTLAQIAQIIADNDGNISNLKIVKSAPDFSELSIDLEVWDLKHLNRLLSDLRERHVVSSASRVNA
ncbi:bifunctional (p)ppGpp synthetase/guanosine-3',5'-bis(diphosphate) 3'-pyrophosphohydrolase [Kaistia algarum]|uniref:RelA/SpoT family protein n=1 Tax=Kaistia algarum TaxID=2083279 RepID=UPI000CE77CF8|nr:bifunctional (p)ppGpp synthetase/guanosine-3',5'-bis(diphosphate) 3'-pyrophosphohydrolase [Kaistia algarum]MCX5515158.1 bifunctional (p)ppGpp synthetase/guanosine-3',5'-bis(diphosphate) 3'-pyrophosphohydrolase [Kaistia algarum]PPE79879.1 bifunctional (p)ppGpp synthetase/guanosine-3',5'-bis(diphosphate) 3'-pyrophosphohydrolase [Kaistia algarum]